MLFKSITTGVAALLAVSVNALPQAAPADTCTVPATTLKSNAKLPNPFIMINGKQITKKEEWGCRRAEILDQFYKYELGVKPPKPESVTATYSGGSLTITCTEKGKSINFKVSIKGNTGGTPVPAIIGYGGGSIPVPSGVATISFNNDEMGAQANSGSRGKGKFFDLYGTSGGQGATTAWAWGVSRIIDALELVKEANIDPKRIGVTGCSRNGKGAFMAGALDERVALTIPQESGSGGSACWRLSDHSFKTIKVQTADEIIGENCWFGSQFDQFAKNKNVNQMPIDHHMLQALVAPRGLYVIENTDMEWLGAMSCYGCSKAASLVYKALGASDNYGFSQIGGHSHCQFPSGQQAELTAFINKFLKGGSGSAGVFRTDGGSKTTGAFKDADWIDWDGVTLA